MPDREKVIKGLEVCVDRDPGKYTCDQCPYENDGNDCEIHLTHDAIDLLKEQERIIKLYEKAESFLHSHGWDWTQVEGWVEKK